MAISAVNPSVAEQLKAALFPQQTAIPAAAAPVVNRAALFEVAVYRMADERDVSPRRVRGPLIRWLRAVIRADLELPTALKQLEARVPEG